MGCTVPEAEPGTGLPAWIECAMCGDFLCTYHSAEEGHAVHAFDCHCPAVEEWHDLNLDPYTDEHPGDEAFA
jgi:hypothetical protein